MSASDHRTREAIFRHPTGRNIEWNDAIGLLGRHGEVDHKANNEWSITIGRERLELRRPHSKDLTPDEVVQIRQLLTRAGISPQSKPADPKAPTESPDLLVAIDHHEARIYRLDLHAHDPAGNTIRPYDPHHFLHHLAHKDQLRQQGQRAAEAPSFYEAIAQALAAGPPGGRIVVVGHGAGHSNAARHLTEWLENHHREIAERVASVEVADLSSLTPNKLLDVGRDALARRS